MDGADPGSVAGSRLVVAEGRLGDRVKRGRDRGGQAGSHSTGPHNVLKLGALAEQKGP